ncbi:MAG: beta-lactamase [Microbacteriaceae bacterium]|nr:beta-lactamase [Microbacteriaceae bacterium]
MRLDGAISEILEAHGAESPPAGAVLSVRRAGRLHEAVGGLRRSAELAGGDDLPMTVDTALDLASISKLFTTAAIMRLVSGGQVGLDDELGRWVPSGGAATGASIRRLMLHRAGLWEWWPLYCEAHDRSGAHAFLDTLSLRYEPDSGRHYSDLGFMMLGRVVEAVVGAPLDRAVQELVLDPLALRSTRYRSPTAGPVAAGSLGDIAEQTMLETGEPYPVPYTVDDFTGWRTGVIESEPNDGNAFHALESVSGHAGIFSTVADLHSFAAALTGRDDLWTPDTASEFFADGPDTGQALGFRSYTAVVDGEAVRLVGHSGYTGSVMAFAPDRELTVVLATNRLHTAGRPSTNDRLWATALGAL